MAISTRYLAGLAICSMASVAPAWAQPAARKRPAPAPAPAPAASAATVATTDTTGTSSSLAADTSLTLRPDGSREEKAITAKEVARAPLPHQASGVARPEPDSTGNRLRVIPRVLLFFPRVAVEIVHAPFRGGLYAYDRYDLKDRARDVFFNDEGTIGIYPVADVTTDFGFTGGARFVYRDIFGADERFSLRASFGGKYRQEFAASANTGDRLSRYVRLSGEAEYQIDPKDRFFGIGNGDEVSMVAAPVDPYDDPAAVDTRFRQVVGRTFGRLRVKLYGPLSVRLSSGALWKRFESPSPGDITAGKDIEESYQTDEIAGFEQGVAYTYNELELRYDSRRADTSWEPEAMPSTGWFIAGYGGVARSFDRGPTNYRRYGGDVQRFFRLGPNPRVLMVRVMAEEVRGADEEIPFVDLPRLGGARYLRGYPNDRFRDRAIALGSAEYQFDLISNFAGFVFVDAGRVYPTLTEMKAEDLRVGYGAGIQIHSQKSFAGRLHLASSIDGGIFVNFSVDPVSEPQKRLERD